MGRREGKKYLGSPSGRWKGNIKMDLKEVEWGGVVWIDMAQDRNRWRALVNMGTNCLVP